MDDEPDVSGLIVCEPDGDTLADAAYRGDSAAFGGGDGRIDRAQHEYRAQAHVLQLLAQDARLKRGDVGGDVRQFGHLHQIATRITRVQL